MMARLNETKQDFLKGIGTIDGVSGQVCPGHSTNVLACDRRKASSSNTATRVHTIVIQLMRPHILITTHPKLAYNYKYVI